MHVVPDVSRTNPPPGEWPTHTILGVHPPFDAGSQSDFRDRRQSNADKQSEVGKKFSEHGRVSLNRCNDLSTRRVFHATYRLRFEEAYAPSAEIWNYQVTNNTITTYASHACKANIDNVFWGPAQSMTRLLNTWSINLPKYSRSPIAADNPERSMCLAATHSSLRVVPYKK